jgi:nucleoside-diphosphate-sugar epimerase
VFVADVRKVRQELGWEPRTNAEAGVSILFDWVKAHPELFRA